MYIHTVKATAIAFSVYHHDVLLHSKPPSNNYDAILIGRYINYLQNRRLVTKPCLNLHFCLLGIFLNIKAFSSSCGIYGELQEDTLQEGILKTMCGKIHIQSVTEMPVHRKWIIDMPNSCIVNTTVMKIDIPYETLNCSYNHLLVYDEYMAEKNYITRLCGRAFGKIFYSNTSLVKIEFTLEYSKHDSDTILSLVYQVHSKLRIQEAVFHDKKTVSGNKGFHVQTLLIKTDSARMDVYYYNTYIWNQISVVLQNINCSEERVLIHDGPSLKSKLLGELQKTNVEIYTFISSLSILSIYFIDTHFSKCFTISVSIFERPNTGQLVNISATETMSMELRYAIRTEHIYNQFQIQVPFDEFINIKMSRFVYPGNTEAGCFLGGIVILPDASPDTGPFPPIGPLCGEFGRVIFEDTRLDGLTLGSYKADIIIFLYPEKISTLELDIVFSGDKCEGIIPNEQGLPVKCWRI